jgi:enoyl-CoA hydratase/carnithine racemase
VSTCTDVLSAVDGTAAVLRLNRPEQLNAFTIETVEALRAAANTVVDDPEIHGIVITGNGRAFTAGLDTGDLTRSTEGALPRIERPEGELPALFSFLLDIPKPVIAAVNGPTAGGGLVLAMMCDLRFASPDAFFTTSFSRRGLIAEHGTSWLLPRLVGPSRALDLLWSARRFDADEAYRIGFVDRVVPSGELVEAACRYVDDLAANASARSVAVMKRQVYRGLSLAADAGFHEADRLTNEALHHPDAKEGVASFVERRPPRFAPPGRPG